jgi:OmpA-OmpF porin, OOP family
MKTRTIFLSIALIFMIPLLSEGQVGSYLKSKANRAVNVGTRAADKKVNEEIDKSVKKGVEDASDKILGEPDQNKDKNEQSKENNQEQEKQQNEGDKTGNTNQPVNQVQTELQSYSKFDFIPGEKVIFYDDFSQDAIGDFPALWNTNGSAEVVSTNLFPGKWMKFVGREAIWTDELLKFPDNYTIEFDIIPIKGDQGGMAGYIVRLIQCVNPKAFDSGSVPGKAGFGFTIEYFGRPSYGTYINSSEGDGLGLKGYKDDDKVYQKENQKYHIAIWVQKARIRLYQNESKLIDLPRAFTVASVKMDRLRFESGAAMVSNVRIAVGAPDTRNKLISEGKLISYGIYFDVNKDVVKPESYGTLKEIATVLQENPDVRVKIVGYTDADGADAANLDLSKRRGASVKNEFIKTFGIDAARLESDGLGESQPVAPNDTPVNKALNRRVEFLKL